MVEYMEKHDSLAKNSLQSAANGRSKKKELWDKLTELLNSNGPPMKPTKAWQKVWTDYKYNAKRKLTQRMRSMTKTGGGPYDAVSLNHMEERIVAAAKIGEHMSGVPGATSYGCHTDGPSCSTAAPQADDTFVCEYLAQISSADNSSSDDEGKTSRKSEPPKINIREEGEIDEAQPAKTKRRPYFP
ncbi:uncharacterized protein LOC128861962 [Anastrepha ludens]|uniref:uncharacterized protein LOC128861962 n=1 Tax=Anastrepha ludens TaxID=28586 RepID=UPI0023AEDCD2|nr:uncharacterized protein LOC128861962 [Anastrepha ludens]